MAQPAMKKKDADKPMQWSKAAKERIERILTRYPENQKQSAVIPLLKLAQDESGGWLPVPAMQLVAETLAMPYIRVYEVATFYTMFNLQPVGKYHVQVCTNCSCMIRGSGEIVKTVREETGLAKQGDITKDGLFTYHEVECLGACVDAPMMQINNHYYTNLTAEKTQQILKQLRQSDMQGMDTPPGEVDPVHYGAYEEVK